MPSHIISACAKVIAEKKLTIAFAESATAGRLASEFSLTAESGQILKGGLVCYDAEIKQTVLHISKDLIEKYTPESSQVTEALAKSLPALIPCDVSVGVTGLTTPGGSESAEKPVGTMFIFIYVNGTGLSERQAFSGSPEQIILQTADRVAAMISEHLQ